MTVKQATAKLATTLGVTLEAAARMLCAAQEQLDQCEEQYTNTDVFELARDHFGANS